MRAKLDDYFSVVFEPELIEEILKVGTLKQIKAGELMIDIGDDLTFVPLLLSGAIKIIREDKNGDEIVIYYLERGDSCAISFANCVHQRKSIFRGIAEKDSEGVFIPVHIVEEWMVKYKTWRHFIIDSYHLRLLEMVEAIESLAFMQMDDRLFKYLSDKAKIMRSTTLVTTHQELADDLNTSRVVVSRLLKQLEREQKIKLNRNKIEVIDF
ncbi:MAG: Crp/Fnr family transcriptional regulator [Flavobacteriaceae bacterium]|jgi:CRP/FNR family transcriptional regulator|nr:Crp/Fnr family transcriptional regulator [Flavobacteriaceae bacterium]